MWKTERQLYRGYPALWFVLVKLNHLDWSTRRVVVRGCIHVWFRFFLAHHRSDLFSRENCGGKNCKAMEKYVYIFQIIFKWKFLFFLEEEKKGKKNSPLLKMSVIINASFHIFKKIGASRYFLWKMLKRQFPLKFWQTFQLVSYKNNDQSMFYWSLMMPFHSYLWSVNQEIKQLN